MDRRLGGSDENHQGVIIRHSNIQGNGKNRKALSTISTNIIKSSLDPSDVHKKGDLTEKIAGSDKNHVSCTKRKFATHLAVQEEEPLQEVDVEGYGMIDDHDVVPMYVQHTEAMMDEIDRMDAEEQDEDEQALDIDSCDKNDPLAVTEYIDDLYSYYKKIESSSQVPPDYMSRQEDINERMRGILVDWLVEVHCRFELMDETLYLTVNLIDRFLAVEAVVRDKLQLVGATALLLACKYEEVAVPAVDDLVLVSDKSFCRDELLNMERVMINALQFKLSVATPYVFIRRFLKAAQSNKRLEMVALFITELCLVEYEMLRFRPSLVAAAAVFKAECAIGGRKKQWSKRYESHTGYREEDLRECAGLMVGLHQNSGGRGRLTAVYRKYSGDKYGCAAWTHPAVFLAEAAAA